MLSRHALRDIQDLIEKGIMIKSEQGGRSTNCKLNSNEKTSISQLPREFYGMIK